MIDRERLVDELLKELNDIRTMPNDYIRFLEERRQHYLYHCIHAGSQVIKTLEGVQPIEELIHELGIPTSMIPLEWSYALHTTADVFAHYLGSQGITGHLDSHGRDLKKRLSDHCIVRGKVVELIQVSGTSSREILTEMLVDDGLATRRRRHNLLDPDFHFIGVGVAPHSVYGYITVIILAQDVVEGAEMANITKINPPAVSQVFASVPTSGTANRPLPIRHDEIRNLAFSQPPPTQQQRCSIF